MNTNTLKINVSLLSTVILIAMAILTDDVMLSKLYSTLGITFGALASRTLSKLEPISEK